MSRFRMGAAIAWLALSVPGRAVAGGGWIQPAGSIYAKVGVSSISTDMFHTNDGGSVKTARFKNLAVQLYGEYGLANRLSAVFDVPAYRRHAFVTASPASGLGDVGLEFKYGLFTGVAPVAVGVGAEFPTGNQDAIGRNFINPADIIHLPTGDGEFNVWTRAYISHSFFPTRAFVTADAGYNFRSKGLTNQYQAGAQAGYRLFEKLWILGNLRRLAPAGRVDPGRIFSSVGIGEGVEYTSYGVGMSYEFMPHTSAAFEFASATGVAKNIYGGANLSLGLAVDL